MHKKQKKTEQTSKTLEPDFDDFEIPITETVVGDKDEYDLPDEPPPGWAKVER